MRRALGLTTLAGVLMVSGTPHHGDAAGIDAMEKERLIVTPEYYIGPEDVLEVMVWRNADLSKVVTVRPDGRISLPLIGDVSASGQTPTALTSEIKRRLGVFLEEPRVSVVLREVKSYSVFVLGEVVNPGRYDLKTKTTLLQAITLAGGFKKTADRNLIVILRSTAKVPTARYIANYSDIVVRERSEQNRLLKPGDTIVVPSEMMVMTD